MQHQTQTKAGGALLPSPQGSALVITHLRLLLGEFHIVKNPEHDSEQVLPPVLFEGMAIALHDLEHDREPSAGKKASMEEGTGGGRGQQRRQWESLGSGGRGEQGPEAHSVMEGRGTTLGHGYLVRTSSLHLLMMQESSKRMGNQPRTQTLSPVATFMSSLVYSCSTCSENHLSETDYASERKELKQNYMKIKAPHIFLS